MQVPNNDHRTAGRARHLVAVAFKLLANGRDNYVFLANETGESNVAGSAKRNDQLTKNRCAVSWAASAVNLT